MNEAELARLDHEMDLIADGFPMGKAFWSSCLYDFKQLLKGSFPDLTEDQIPALFERWAHRYEERDKEQERVRGVQTLRLWYERDRLQTQLKFLPDGPERAAIGKRLWELANKVADLYAPRRPQSLAAKWAADED